MNSSKFSIASVGTAIGASLCCSLPIVASILGIGLFSGVTSFFSEYRIYFLIFTGLLLSLAYYTYYRKSKIDCECNTDTKKKFSIKGKVSLASITVLVLFFSFLPEILSAFQTDQAVSQDYRNIAIVKVEGMTCQSCASHLESELNKIKGVAYSSVDFETGIGKVYIKNAISEELVKKAIMDAGYKVRSIKWQQK